MAKSKNYCFTMNNYEGTELVDSIECAYIIYGKEVGASGTPHLQGLVRWNNERSLAATIKALPGCHVEVTKSLFDAIEYCKKEGDWTERGTPPKTDKQKGEGEKERYKRARSLAEEGKFDEIDADIYIRHLGNLKKIRAEKQVQPAQLTELSNQWLYGPPGSGKTSRAFAENPSAYLKGLNKWWDGYTNQEAVIIDDMDPFHKSLAQEFKAWAHHAPFPAESKGGTMCLRPKKIIVTSNYSIDEVWDDSTTREAMHRRFNEVYIGTPARPNPIFN